MKQFSIKPTKLIQADPFRGHIFTIAAVLALAISTVLSTLGIKLFLEQLHLASDLVWPIAVLSTTLLTVSIYLAGVSLGRSVGARLHAGILHNRPSGTPAISAGILMAVIAMSSITSFSSLFFARNAEQLQGVLSAGASSSITSPIDAVLEASTLISAQTTLLSDLALTKSNDERQSGMTCAPSTLSSPGDGPIAAIRAQQAADFGRVDDIARSIATQASGIGAIVAATPTNASLEAAFLKSKALKSSAELIEMRVRLTELRDGFAGSGFYWDGAVHFCDDPALVVKLDVLLSELSNMPSLPETAPRFSQPDLFDVPSLLLELSRGNGDRSGIEIQWSSIIMFAVIALGLDLFGASTAFKSGKLTGERLTDQERDQLKMNYWVLKHFVWSFPAMIKNDDGTSSLGYKTFLVVPEGGDGHKSAIAERYAYAFGLVVDPRFQHCPLSSLPTEFAQFTERMRLTSGGALTYTLYPVSSADTCDLIEAEKRLSALALWPQSVDTEMFGDIDDKEWRREHNKAVTNLDAHRAYLGTV